MTTESILEYLERNYPHIQWSVQASGCIVATINDMEIVDPYRSECGRFSVSPQDAYGMPQDAALRMDCNNRKFPPEPF